ncbi:nucleotidyl transferase AbiEii/AbiGii toxin family protein [Herbaspirillum sp. RTI4]|uniref:nucleotidyl transferase AbiEii/AbiGii toxin family protein n=1 Tax=Herbaspirillum sp. RTI4 TaxID=3048640 RepID=UPI002AB36510|nr:nucleotidyl transferase AbiEii/AbiGii toxin family protein [Herbaspirillum sp. RTI4]MDY7578140.1 nucleotidyl transferase AbiEii/AbiGii toxin family protein [Herbaspirillum sp. RTI4]MEA9980729.1 nucleotidyl transferase AbiEii/AbiGii toxin family protein [Herbaspirillum sp. RTI4]
MAEFFQLSTAERLEALDLAANTSGLLPHLLEKNIWVVWSLRHLFADPYADHLVFKGGTSLSKAYGVIRRFSEDVDLTYDIRAIAADLVGEANAPLPASKSQEKKWSKEIRARLSDWVGAEIVPRLKHDLEQNGLPATVRAEGEPIDTTTLIPHMLEAFMERDRVFKRSSRSGQSSPLIIHAKPMNHVSDSDTPEPVHSKK